MMQFTIAERSFNDYVYKCANWKINLTWTSYKWNCHLVKVMLIETIVLCEQYRIVSVFASKGVENNNISAVLKQ